MSEGDGYIEILFWAAVAGFVLLRLRSVLGRRTGHEQRGNDPFQAPGDSPAERPAPRAEATPVESRAKVIDMAKGGESSPVNEALSRIRVADRSFEPAEFLEGARAAYAMIVDAFAKGDEAALKPLLSDEVFADFQAAIAARKAAGESMEARVEGIARASIAEAAMVDGAAEIAVRFESDIVRATRDAESQVIDGDPTDSRRIIDVWTFARKPGSSDPNWKLIATAAES